MSVSKPVEIPQNVLDRAPQINLSRRGILKGLAIGTVFPIVNGCVSLEQTDGFLANMSNNVWSELKQQSKLSTDKQLNNYVMGTWSRLVKGTPKAQEQWDVAIFDEDTVNAFVMPGNRVGVYRGITELSENSDQLSTVLGHEVGHSV